jgi:high affinity sulfate transporter 1
MDGPGEKGVATGGYDISRWVPGLRVARTYERSWTRPDLVAGVVLAAILVPQGMAYAELAGLPPVTGLYTTIACLVGYAVFGPSRVLVLGPDSSISPMILAALMPLLVAGGDPHKAIVLAGMLAIIVALIEIGLGVARLGFVADLLSNEVQVGYMNGLALVIIVGQLPKLFGFSTEASGWGPEIKAFVLGLDGTVGAALVVGLGVLAILLVLPRFTRLLPAVLVGIVAATVVSAIFALHDHGVATVGTLPRGIPTPSLPWTRFSDIGPLMVAALGITVVSLADTIATSSSFAARRGEEVDPNQEMIGIGAANLAAGFLQGFAVSTSGSRTAVVEQAGAKSQLASVVGAAAVAVLLLFFNSLLADLPQSALAAVLIAAALSLLNLSALVRYARVRKSALALSLITSLGVVVLGVLQGIVIAIVLAILLFFHRGWHPRGAILGQVEELDGWHNVARYPDAREIPGIVVLRWEAPLFFANAAAFRTQVRRIVADRRVTWVVVQCQAVTDVDVSAAQMLESLDVELNAKGMHMAFVEMRARLQDLVFRYGLYETLDRERFYPTLDAGLAAIERESSPPEPPEPPEPPGHRAPPPPGTTENRDA